MEIRIEVERKADGYIGSASLGDGLGPRWVTPEPLSKQEIMRSLLMIGVHERDAWDALAFADGKAANTPHPFFEQAMERMKKSGKDE
jgi:hypothetical protein